MACGSCTKLCCWQGHRCTLLLLNITHLYVRFHPKGGRGRLNIHPSVWNLRAATGHLFWFSVPVSSLVFLPSPLALSVLSFLFFLMVHSPASSKAVCCTSISSGLLWFVFSFIVLTVTWFQTQGLAGRVKCWLAWAVYCTNINIKLLWSLCSVSFQWLWPSFKFKAS